MKIRRFRLAVVLTLIAGPAAAEVFSEEVRDCRVTVIKAASKYTSKLAKLVGDCHAKRANLMIPGATDCNDLQQAAAALGKTLPAAIFKSDPGAPGAVCDGILPEDAKYTSCPAPCDSIVPTDWTDVDDCMRCQIRTHIESFASSAYGQATLPLSDTDATCAEALYSAGTKIITPIVRADVACQKEASTFTGCGLYNYPAGSKLVRARIGLSTALANKCSGANFAAIGSCATELGDAGCASGFAQSFGELLAYDASRMLSQDFAKPQPDHYVQVVGGGGTACGLRPDGSVTCWGNTSAASPGKYTQIAMGYFHGCGIREDATVDCWGLEYETSDTFWGRYQQLSSFRDNTCALGLDGSIDCKSPVLPPSPGPFIQVCAGATHACALHTDGTVECSGADYPDFGQLDSPPGPFTQVACGEFHSCGIHLDGTVECWGYNNVGQATAPAGVFVEVSPSSGRTCGRHPDNTVECWGSGDAHPTASGFSQISNGCGVRMDGTAECWDDDDGERSVPGGTYDTIEGGYDQFCTLSGGALSCWGNVVGTVPGGTFTQINAGNEYQGTACGVQAGGTGVCWGNNDFGQAAVPPGNYVKIVTGGGGHPINGGHSCGLKSDQSLSCWGDNSWGQANAPAGSFIDVSTGNGHACAIRVGGAAECWGIGWDGAPFPQPPSGTFVKVVSASEHACAIRTDGTVACWGQNNFGDTVPPPGTFREISAGLLQSCGIRTDGTLACWNEYKAPPPPPGTFISLSSGTYSNCAIRSDGREVCWGGGMNRE